MAFAAPVHGGNDPSSIARAPRGESSPKPDLERPSASPSSPDGKPLCKYVTQDPNAPGERNDCIADREPVQQRPAERTPPAAPGNDATPSIAPALPGRAATRSVAESPSTR
jgi:hypothetical protein